MNTDRRWQWGAQLDPAGRARFRLWAPRHGAIALRAGGRDRPMQAVGDDWFELTTDDLAAGTDYAFVLPDGTAVPDPAARAQSGDVHSPSVLTAPGGYDWQHPLPARGWEEAVIYELHIGTFTEQGTFAAAIEKLAELAETGITAIELMPVAQFAGRRGWGYDGVLLYAPHNAYGTPDEMKALIDAAHGHGMMVLLDVVYNHFGPEGNYLGAYANFFDAARHTPWGGAIAYEEPHVRAFFTENALYWLDEFRLDGLRLDAIDHIVDPSEPELLVELAQMLRRELPDRPVHLTTEDNRNITRLHARGPAGEVTLHTAEWNDDFHNVAHVIASGESEGYYVEFTRNHWALFARALAEGFAYQGQVSPHSGRARGVPSAHLPPTAFVDFLQNHDQIGNRAFGERLITLTRAERLHALQAILLLSPHIPLLFMGEEFDEHRPFCFFTDFHGELADAVRQGRRAEFADFAAFAGDHDQLSHIPDPNDPDTFAASRLDWARAASPEGRQARARLRDLLACRHRHIVPHLRGAGADAGRIVAQDEGAVSIDWRLSGAMLRLRTNLADVPNPLAPARGEAIWGAGADALPAAPACSVHVFLDRGATE
ncbi:malto-oligosyltrehalose trehalohydrolase [Brevirhabdus sp.]|uniref:malto-oligosyltrehalose trehalohydrolase n=1 Tax=Brevirhabdus sp. TaxID=2004514 RepID=UPI004059091D